MATPDELKRIMLNYTNELESMQIKYDFWFGEAHRSVYDLFLERDAMAALRTDIEIPQFIRDEIEVVRNWYWKVNF